MNRVAWSPEPALSRISIVCQACADLMRRKCEIGGFPFYSRLVHGKTECESCGQVEMGLNLVS